MNKTKLAGILGTAGIVTGLIYGIKKNKGLWPTVAYTGIFAVVGVIIGNQVTKFYE